MTIEEQREAIREGLVRFCECEHMGDSEECPNCEFGLAFADRILAFLTEMGAVLKTEGEMARCGKQLQPSDCTDNCWGCQSYIPSTPSGTAPLIEKK